MRFPSIGRPQVSRIRSKFDTNDENPLSYPFER